jgi:hypothetical protein
VLVTRSDSIGCPSSTVVGSAALLANTLHLSAQPGLLLSPLLLQLLPAMLWLRKRESVNGK